MVVWQFTTIAALIGAVLIYVMVLTNRVANTNALLKRIEEALARAQLVAENVPVAAVERRVAEEAPAPPVDVEEETAADTPDRDRRVSFLTVRDLKVIARSGRRSSDSTVGVSPVFAQVFGNEIERLQSQPASPVNPAVETGSAVGSVVTEESVAAAIERHNAGASCAAAVVEELAVATNEMREFLDTPPSPAIPAAAEALLTLDVERAASGLETAAVHREPAVSNAEPLVAPVETLDNSAEASPPSGAPDITAANEDEPTELPAPTAVEAPAVAAAVYSVEPPPPGVPEITAANEETSLKAPAPAAVEAPPVDAELEETRRRNQQHFMLARRRHRMR